MEGVLWKDRGSSRQIWASSEELMAFPYVMSIRYVAFFSSLPLFIFPLLEEGVWLARLGIKGKRSGIELEFDLEQITK